MSDHQTCHEFRGLGQDFPSVPTEIWDEAIQKELNGDCSLKLIWHTDEGIAVLPYYRSEVLLDLAPQLTPIPGQFPFVRGNEIIWEIDQGSTVRQGAVRADLILEAGGDAVQQLGIALAAGVEKLVQLSENQPIDIAAREIDFVFAISSLYFIEIAKLRAARMLWARVVEQFAPTDLNVCKMNLHARTAMVNKSFCDPHTNLLRATTEVMSAVIGGCKSLTIQPFGFDEHLAANIHRIVTEEAHLNEVADPGGGSYYIEALTSSLAQNAWKLFQRIEGAGGYSRARAAGWLEPEIGKSRLALQRAISSRRRLMVGVNDYPDLTEKDVKSETDFADVNSPFATFRLAEPFEAIRQRTQRHSRMTGHTPKVLLLKRGDLTARTARANFALNFFGCAGLDITSSEEYAGANAELIVLCSSDREYLAFAQEVCAIVRVPVVVAGNPADQIDALQAAGVQDFVHVDSDLIETLTNWQNRLGVIA